MRRLNVDRLPVWLIDCGGAASLEGGVELAQDLRAELRRDVVATPDIVWQMADGFRLTPFDRDADGNVVLTVPSPGQPSAGQGWFVHPAGDSPPRPIGFDVARHWEWTRHCWPGCRYRSRRPG